MNAYLSINTQFSYFVKAKRLVSKIALCCLLWVVAGTSYAQYTNVHYIAPSPWNYFNRFNELVITTTSTTPVAVTIAASNGIIYSNSLTTVAGAPLRYRFPATDASANFSNVVLSGQGLKISASVPIGVQVRNIASDYYTVNGQVQGAANNCVQKGNTAFTSLGDQGLGTSFRVGYYANVSGITCYAGETAAPLYTVMAINNNTNVYVNGALLTTLNAGQSYIFQTAIGSIVTASDNVVMNSSMRADNSSGCGDGVASQIIPIANLGNTYVVVRSNGNSGYERTTIVATKANTTVTVTVPSTNNTTTYTLATAGSFVTINNGDGSTAYSSCYIESTEPVAVYTGSADGCEIDMIVQPPLNNCAGSFDVQTNQFLNNSILGNAIFPYFGYVIIKSDTAIVYFNGVNLESIVGKRTQIGKTGYYLIRYTNTQLGNPANLRFVVNARINVALIESGAGYSMSAFISSISNPMPPPSASSNCLPTTFTAQGGFNSYQWYKDSVAITGATTQTYVPTTSGLYSVTGTNQNCGTSAMSTAVAVNPKPNAGPDQTVCNNSTVTLTGTSPTTNTWIAQANNPAGATLGNTANGIATVNLSSSAVGNYNFIYSAGCADTVTIVVRSTSRSVTTASICAGNTYTFNGKSYTASIVDTVRLTNSVGCDSLAILNLTVRPTSSSTTTASICAGNSYTFNGTVYTTSGTYSRKFTNSVGCDSIAYLVLTVNPTSSSTTNASICAGSSYSFNGTTYTTAGTYTARLTNSKGCDSIATLVLTVRATSSSTTTASICAGTTYTFNGVSYSNAGTYTARLTNAQGCDSIATLILTVKSNSSSTTNVSIVSGNAYTFNDTTYTTPGTYTARLTNAQGCDSIATLVLSVTSLSTTNATICAGNTYVFNGVTYSTSGTYTAKLKNMYGFDSTATLILTVRPTSSSTTNASICAGQSYTFNGVTYTNAGTYTTRLTNSVGCDSIATLVLAVRSTSSSTTNASICSGQSYTFNGVTYTAAGTYTAKLTNSVGCDSTATLNLTVRSTSSSTTTASICAGTTYTFNGVAYSTSGTYTAKLTNSVGCDSIATLILTVRPTSSSTTTASICAGRSFTFNGVTYTASGTYTAKFTNSVGCDSVATLVLTVNANPTVAAITGSSSVCLGSPITYSNTTTGGVWSSSNSGSVASINPSTGVISPFGSGVTTITYTVTNASGCSSQVTKSLNVNPVPSVAPISGASGTCVGSSVQFSNISYGGVWSSNNTSVANVDADGTVSGISAGTAIISYTLSTATCSTTVTKSFTTLSPSASTTNLSICASALPFTWNGIVFTAAGTQTARLTNAVGCDSVATLNLTVKSTSASTTNISVCPSALPYLWNGLTLNAAGTYTKTLVNAVGCDSVATLNLTVKSTSVSTTNISICPSALPYSWNGLTLNAAGTYTKTLTNAVGCDSVATLNLSVKSTSESTTNISICPSALPYSWNGLTLNAAGTYTKTLTNSVGCDSVATLNLTVKSTSASTTNISVCPSDLPYSWNGLTLNAAGTYTKTLVNAVGCDSVATLVLTVTQIPNAAILATASTICEGQKVPTLSALNAAGISKQWFLNDSLIANSDTLLASVAGSYRLRYAAAGCYGVLSPSVAIGYVAQPTIQLVSSLCLDSTTKAIASINGGNWGVADTNIATIQNTGWIAVNKVGATTVKYKLEKSGCNFEAQHYLAVTDCSGGVTSGVTGGLESKSLGLAVASRHYREVTNTAIQPTAIQKNNLKEVGTFGATEATLQSYLPSASSLSGIIGKNVLVANSSPTDLTDISNATNVYAQDYVADNTCKAVAFVVTTSGMVYSHTKSICDRLKGATIQHVNTININSYQLLQFRLQHADGTIEYYTGFSCGKNSNSALSVLQSNWLNEETNGYDDMQNFQLWASSSTLLRKMASEVLQNVSSFNAIVQLVRPGVPPTYIMNHERNGNKLVMNIVNNNAAGNYDAELQVKKTETSGAAQNIQKSVYLQSGQNKIVFDLGDVFEAQLYLNNAANSRLEDVIYSNDGTWNYAYDATATKINRFTVTSDTIGYNTKGATWRVSRNPLVQGNVQGYVSIYKLLKSAGMPVDLSTYKGVRFNCNASVSGVLEVTLVKHSIKEWNKQYQMRIPVQAGTNDIKLSISNFLQQNQVSGSLLANDITTVNFSFIPNVSGNVALGISELRFTALDEANEERISNDKTLTVYPNPLKKGQSVQVKLNSGTASRVQVQIIELATGKQVYTNAFNVLAGENKITISQQVFEMYNQGNYQVYVRQLSADGQIQKTYQPAKITLLY